MSHAIEFTATEQGAVIVVIPDAHGNPQRFLAYTPVEADDMASRLLTAINTAIINMRIQEEREAQQTKSTYTPETKPVVKRKGRT